MSCSNCENNQNPYAVYNVQYVYKNDCADCANSECDTTIKAGCVFYTSANLPNSGILTNDSLEVALQKIDAVLAATAGSYAGYNIHCLGAPGSITTEAQFVSEITSYVCDLNTTVTTFTGTTFPAYQTAVDARFDAIEVPGITCTAASVVNTDTLNQVLTKYCTKFGAINTALDISSVVWDVCFAVLTPPTTIAGGFTLILDQICQLKNGGTVDLPEFNNIGSVLASPGAADSLESTVIKLRDRINLVPTFNINTLTWDCIAKPSSTNIDLQSAFQAVLTKIDALAKALPTFNEGDFLVENVDDLNLCLGKSISLAASAALDRYVAVNEDDSSPGTLMQKLLAGTNITFDTDSVAGKLIINASGTADAFTVKASTTIGAVAGTLEEKITGSSSDGLNITALYNAGTDKLVISGTLEMGDIVDAVLDAAETNDVVKARLCAIMASCPSPCSAPQNVQVIPV